MTATINIMPRGMAFDARLPALRADSLAYFDSTGGLVPCRVGRVYFKPIYPDEPDFGSSVYADIELTASRGVYHKGETYSWPASMVVPRRAVRMRKYGARVLPYRYVVEGEQA